MVYKYCKLFKLHQSSFSLPNDKKSQKVKNSRKGQEVSGKSRCLSKVKESQPGLEVSERLRSPRNVKFRQGKEFPIKWPTMNNFEEVLSTKRM